ncbi:MAG: dienelactone hydrolase family protein, partial [Bacillota bacterium]
MDATISRQIVHVPADGVVLEGAVEAPPGARGVIVFAHGSGSSRVSPRNRYVAAQLRRSAFATLLFDLLNQQEDGDAAARFDIALLARRLRGAVEWARERPELRGLPVGLFGASTGAAAAIEVGAALGEGVSAVVSRGGRPDLASDIALRKLSAPTLLIVGGDDAEVIELNEAA